MIINAIIQARMSSTRLPGKTMRSVAGRPLIQFLLERLAHCDGLDGLLIATSDDPSDERIAEYCAQNGLPCYRGPRDDVAGRFRQATDAYPCDAFVRLCADSPLLDPRLIDRAVKVFRRRRFDVVTNVQTRTFPRGQSVEVVRCDAFRIACDRMNEPADREHVTRYFYRRPDEFRIRNIDSGRDWSGIRMAVDDAQSLALFEAVLGSMHRPHWQYPIEKLVERYEEAARAMQEQHV